ncbi:unnamed protein product [Hydatigera taeniaeformis]|uniref:HTH CENPB-type domain-containing protein n=1 Tax=Hydatigena taeniaeformis TaxID=6205 RepID=A0A0R3WY63_HYDTA|nr:unnamed protein product [Hydatigera taeniaeformis]
MNVELIAAARRMGCKRTPSLQSSVTKLEHIDDWLGHSPMRKVSSSASLNESTCHPLQCRRNTDVTILRSTVLTRLLTALRLHRQPRCFPPPQVPISRRLLTQACVDINSSLCRQQCGA